MMGEWSRSFAVLCKFLRASKFKRPMLVFLEKKDKIIEELRVIFKVGFRANFFLGFIGKVKETRLSWNRSEILRKRIRKYRIVWYGRGTQLGTAK